LRSATCDFENICVADVYSETYDTLTAAVQRASGASSSAALLSASVSSATQSTASSSAPTAAAYFGSAVTAPSASASSTSASSSAAAPPPAGKMWQYKTAAADANVYGPFPTESMLSWAQQVCLLAVHSNMDIVFCFSQHVHFVDISTHACHTLRLH
jgi:hypothetical protein